MTSLPVAVAAGLLILGCRPAPPPPAPTFEIPAIPEPAVSPWGPALTAVHRAVESGRYAEADSILTAYSTEHAGTPEAADAVFWQALLKSDPANPASTTAGARAALESYLGLEGASRRIEAGVIRRLLSLADSLRSAQLGLRAGAELRERSKEEELQKLRDELQKTQAELERIKRRLGSPKP